MKKLLIFIMILACSLLQEVAAYNPMVVPGRTWWYNSPGQGPKWQAEYGITIGDAEKVNGEEWYPAKIIMYYTDDYLVSEEDREQEYSTEEIRLCYIRENDGEVCIKADSTATTIFRPLDHYFLFYGLPDGNIPLYKFGEPGDISTFPDYLFKPFEYKINEIGIIENSGSSFKQYTTIHDKYLDFYPQTTYTYLEKIGHPSNLFLHPGRGFFSSNFMYAPSELRYVTDPDGSILYEGKGGFKLWEYDPTGVESVVVDSVSSVEKWYNLNGVEIAKPQNAGVYIRRSGKSSEKVVVR